MNKEIKFRAWDTIENCWKIFDIPSMFEAEKVFNYKYRNFSNWQQFTGLKDKNGKEIYERDVLSVVSNKTDSKERIVEMKFEEHNTGDFTNFSIWGFRDYSKSTYGATVEIVGKMYENPDLIK